jgi:hypothetical protein
MPTWYDDASFLLHYDHPFADNDYPTPLTGFDREQAERLIAEVRPDVVQYLAKGQPGYVPYRTRFGNELTAVTYDPNLDLLRAYREITRELGIRFVIGYSGLIDYRAAEERSEWLRVGVNYTPYGNRALCPNSGYVDELMLPQLDEILEMYQPDGIWIDGDNWTVSPCYCSVCTSEYQMLRGRSAPITQTDPWWPEWLQFHRESFGRYITRVARYLHDRSPQLVYASNAAWATHQPESTPTGPDRLTWDLSPAFSLRQASMEARALGSRELPFDLMTWNRCSARPWARGRLPALPAYPKTFEHLAQEGSAILANGGRWTVWISAYTDDSLPESQHKTVAKAAAFARERQPWCHGTLSAAYVAVLHSAATHQKVGNGLYDPGPSLDRIRGAHQALLELHHPHDIVNEETLIRELNRYSVVILPEQVELPRELDAVLSEWIQHGGRLIASGRVGPHMVDDLLHYSLEEALGVRWTGRYEDGGTFLHRGLPLKIEAPIYPVVANEAEIVMPLLRADLEHALQDHGYPAVIRHVYGSGEGFYIAADFFAAYHRSRRRGG